MRRHAYLALSWPTNSAEAQACAEAIARPLDADPRWVRADACAGLQLWTSRAQPPCVRALPRGAGFVVGDLHPMPGAARCALDDSAHPWETPLAVATGLSRAYWGRYVALLKGADGVLSAYRDPSGDMGAVTWTYDAAVAVITSEPAMAPPRLLPRTLGLDWDRIWAFLASPSAVTTDPLFAGIEAIGPGELATVGDPSADRRLVWSPADFTATADATDPETPAALVAVVDVCTATLVGSHDQVLMELSGGLDSAIIAGALGAAGLTPRVAQWINRAAERPEADETAYARAVAARQGVDLVTVIKPVRPLEEADLRELAQAFWPAMGGADVGRDRDEAARLQATGATGLVSGQGGDAAFFQMPTALVMCDALRAHGVPALAGPLLGDVARRTRQSIWGVLREVLQDRRGERSLDEVSSPYVTRAWRGHPARPVHPWVQDARARGVPPAKTLQIAAMSAAHLFHGESRRRALADPIYPLFAQPVLELCLAVPAAVLAGGSHDRLYARRAFAARLPDLVRTRRTKGDQSAYYAKTVAVSLAMLRPYLLEGCLAEAGVLDRGALDRALTVEQLIWGGDPTKILWAATVEAWVRRWQGRVPDSARAPRLRR